MQCTECGEANRDAARFCAACGSALCAACASCGNELAPGARFCDRCGAATGESAGGEASSGTELRKTVTILFADLVGSTSLQEKLDPESVRRVMTRFYEMARAVIEAHDGSVVKFVGDGVMAAFGTPVVREDDALRAVRAAHALVIGLAELNDELERDRGVRLQLRAGVNTGEVVVGGEDGDLIGDPVNVAARLEQAAGAGAVLVGEQTERLVRREVTLEPVAPLELKGKSGSARAFRLLAVVAAPAPEGGAAPEAALVGRAPEMERLRAAFEDAVTARACRLVTVIGSPGIGKTRLADELARSVDGRAVVLTGRCEPTDGGITFAPVVEVLRAAAGIGEGDDTEQAREKLTRLLPEGDDREVVVERALGVLGAVPAASTEETFWGVRRVLEALARRQPLVLILDDIHWGQPTYLDLVEHLVEWTRDAPLLLLALARPELRELRESLAGGRRVSDVIQLDPLGAADSRTLVDELLGQAELPERLAERVLRATEGNPLFVGETVRMLVDEGVLRREGETWVVAGDDVDVEMPPTIHALIAARLERLGGDERAVVERASVIGKQFYRGAVADLCSYPVGRGIDGHLETLRRKELVQPEGTYWIDEPVFRFHHVLIRDAAYRSVLKEARAELHERFADWLESKAGDVIGEHEEVVAFHLEQAHAYRDQLGPLDQRGRALGTRAAERLASAGRRALAREDLPAAANLLGRALDRLDEGSPTRAQLLLDLAETLLSAGDTHAAASVVQELHGAAGDDETLRARAAVYDAQLAYLTDGSQLHDTVASVAALADELAALGDEAGVAKASHVQAAALAHLGQVAAAEAALDRALAAARNAGDVRRVSAVLAGAPLAALWGPSPVVRASGRCLDVVRILRMTPGNRHLEAAALSCQAVLEAMRGRAQAARSMLDACRATFEELGLSLELLENEVHAALVELLDGDAAAAEAPLRSAYEGFAALGAGTGTERAAALLARTLLDQGRDEEAAELIPSSEDGAGEDLKATIAWCGVRAEVLARRGEHDAAEQLARRGAEMAAQTDALTDHADARMALAAVLRAAGRDDEARSEAERALELYREKENASGAERAARFAGVILPAASRVTEPEREAEPEADAVHEPGPEGPPSVPRALMEHFVSVYNARDFDALREVMSPNLRILDHRPAGWGALEGRETFVEMLGAAIELAPDAHISAEPLALGTRAVVGRLPLRGHLEAGGGEFELPLLVLAVFEDQRVTELELFGAGEEAAALTRFEEIGARTEWERVWARVCRTRNARDWDGLRDCYDEEHRLIDHRSIGWEVLRGAEAMIDMFRSWDDVAPDVELWFEPLAVEGDHAVARIGGRGHAAAGGGAMEYATTTIATIRDGRILHDELFGADAEPAAMARFEELRAANLRAGAAAAPRELAGVYDRALQARDWEGVKATFTPDLKVVDHRLVGWGELNGADAYVEVLAGAVALIPDLSIRVEFLACGARAWVARNCYRGHMAEGGGEAEIATLSVSRMADAKVDHFELFDDSDIAGALARFEEIGAATEPERVYARLIRCVNTRDFSELADCYSDDFETIDHRVLGWAPLNGPAAIVEMYRSWITVTPDLEVWFDVLSGDEECVAVRYGGRGHAADGGGEMQFDVTIAASVGDGRLVRCDMFAEDEETAAVAALQELAVGLATRDLSRRRRPREAPAAMRELADRYVAVINARDWDALRSLYAPELRFLDRRLIGWGELEGADAVVEILSGTLAMAPDLEISYEPLALGRRGNVIRQVVRGHMAEGGGEFEVEMLTVALADEELFTYFELFEGADVGTALVRFEEIGAETEPERVYARLARAVSARDWGAVRACFADDFEGVDHRTLGWEPSRGPDSPVDFFRSAVQLMPEVELRFELLDGDDRHAAFVSGGHGRAATEAGGGAFEIVSIFVLSLVDGRIHRAEQFEVDQHDAALGRLAELVGG